MHSKSIERTNQFKKDTKRMLKRGKKLEKLKKVVLALYDNQPLAPKHFDHKLSGNYHYARECHIEPDWLLIYTNNSDCLILERTGTHADLFE